MNEEYFQELNRLKDLCHLPSVQKALDVLINEGRQVREPIRRTKVSYTLLSYSLFFFFCLYDLLGTDTNKIYYNRLCLVSKCCFCNVMKIVPIK